MLAALPLVSVVTSGAHAQDAAAGKTLYKTYCQGCHSPVPSTAIAPFNQIMKAANNPAQIIAASNGNPSQMGFITATFTPVNLQDIAAYLATFLSVPATVDVIEFYHGGLDHYFISAASAEIADLDNGVHAGWARTGLSFRAHAAAAMGTSPVCRFYIPPANGDSHFYSASGTECSDVQTKFAAFTYETPGAFYIGLPDVDSGACAVGTIPVYRVWNARPDTNHRYTTSVAVRGQMVAAGWVAEGYGLGQVIMCAVPQP